MSVRLFKPGDVSPQAEADIDAWASALSDVGLTCSRGEAKGSEKWGKASVAPMAGEPFILAGATSAIDEYLRALDSKNARVLRNFADFWVLTSSKDYRHSRLPDGRPVVLDWHTSAQDLVRAAVAVRVHFFNLGEISPDDTARIVQWTHQLSGVRIDDSHARLPEEHKWKAALRSVWLGDPFVLVGKPDDLDKYFRAIDTEAAGVLKDCAYCWILTDTDDYRNSRLPTNRLVTLNWKASAQNVIRDAARQLARFPRLRGLSKDSERLRREIERIAADKTGPGCSVLILGPSGSGKEEVAQSLFRLSTRREGRLQPVSGAWLNMEPGMAMTELVGLARGPRQSQCDGLLKQLRDGAIFFDDFESAPIYIQETLLRIMSVPEGAEAPFRPVGAAKEEFTNAWLFFATNKNLKEFFSEKGLRMDFLYRFGARIIGVSALRERPADIPAIAHAVWDSIWFDSSDDDRRREPLRSDAIRTLVAKGVKWDGNVRTLAALLKLVASMMRDSAWNGFSQGRLIDLITARGPSYMDWIGPVVSGAFRGPGEAEDKAVEADARGARRPGEADEAALKTQLEAALDPSNASLVGRLDKALRKRRKPGGKERNDPGRHLFFAAMVFLAGKPSHAAGSSELQNALGVSPTQLNKLCQELFNLLKGPLRALCLCKRDSGKRYRFKMPDGILRRPSGPSSLS